MSAVSAREPYGVPENLVAAMVDDDPEDVRIVERLLQRSSYATPKLVHLESISKAANWLQDNRPDVILLDYLMDGAESGIDLLNDIAQPSPAPVIMLTGARQPGLQQEAFTAGAFDFLDKAELNADGLARAIRYAVLRYETEERLKESERRLQAAARLAEETLVNRASMLSRLNHELRTPMNAVIGFSDMLRDEALTPSTPEAVRAYAADVFDSGRQVLELIESIVDLERMAAGRRHPEETIFPLDVEIDQARQLVLRKLTRIGGRLVVDPALAGVSLRGDRAMIQQAFAQVLSNAVAAIAPGGTVRIERRKADDALVIAVVDDGTGMKPDAIAQALDVSGPARGRGVGLPISAELMRLHGGLLEIESAPGAGCAILLTFPAERIVFG